MTSVDVGLCIPADQPAPETARLAAMAEDAGFDHIWVTDTQGLWRDVYPTLALVAQATARARIGTMVTNPVTRHPTVTAGAIATVDELSGGRAILGLGAGRSSVRLIGRRERLSECREAALQIRRLLRGETVTYDGSDFALSPALQRPVPVYVSGTGPKMLRAAAEVGDGVVFVVGATVELARYALDRVHEGLERAGKERSEVYLVNYVQCAVAPRREEAYEAARAMAGFHWRELTVPSEVTGLEAPSATYDYARHYSADNDIRRVVPDEVVDRFVVSGTPGDVTQRLGELAAAGVDQIAVYPTRDLEAFLGLAASADLPGQLRARARD